MDNHYVPNLTVGPLVCAAIAPHASVPIDVHLMVKPVDRIVPDFAAAGAAFISFHPEATEHIDRTIELIREHGCKPGLVFNPATPLDYLDYTLEKLDMHVLQSGERGLFLLFVGAEGHSGSPIEIGVAAIEARNADCRND